MPAKCNQLEDTQYWILKMLLSTEFEVIIVSKANFIVSPPIPHPDLDYRHLLPRDKTLI